MNNAVKNAKAPKSSKEDKQLAVSIAILEIIEKDGLLGVSHAKVSRRAGVSRAWIYEYIGKELIEFGADVFANRISRAEQTEIPQSKEALQAQLKDGVGFFFDTVEMNPLIIKLYFRFRGTDNAIGAVIQKYEQRWLSSATRALTTALGLPADHARLLADLVMTLRLGFAHRLATSKNSRKEREKIERILDLINGVLAG